MADPRQWDGLLARVGADGGPEWYLRDNIHSVRQIVGPDGTVLNAITYDSFGRVVSETNPVAGDRFQYTGREYDAELGLYYYRARYYDPSTGRFLSEDPLSFAAGDSNLYRYVGNNPVNRIDPSGLLPPDPPFAINEAERDAEKAAKVERKSTILGIDFTQPPEWWESFVPVLGSGHEAYYSFQNGKIMRGLFHTFLAVTDVCLGWSALKAGGKLVAKGAVKLASREAIEEATVRSAIETSEKLTWKELLGGARIVYVEEAGVWVKEVNPNASWLMRQYAKKSLDVQAAGLRKLDDMAPRFVYQDGKLVVEHVGDTIPGESFKALVSDPLFRRSYLRGSWRLGTPFNDIRPRNMGQEREDFRSCETSGSGRIGSLNVGVRDYTHKGR